MNLIFDIGNSRVKSAIFKDHDLIENSIADFDLKLIQDKIHLFNGNILVSSVIDIYFDQLKSAEKPIYVLDSRTKIPIKNSYLTPETLGNDRLANAVAIHLASKGKNALAIDCGTCLKFDLVIKGDYLGGSISPGLTMRFKSLHTFTGKLPLVEIAKFDDLVGKNTTESILSGCYRGMLAEIKQTIIDYENEYGKLEIYLTGGDHPFFADALKNRIFADPFLTLKGLNEILLFQNK